MKVVRSRKDVLTIPNLLSFFRVILSMVFLGVFYNPDVENKRAILTLILVVSAISDLLDGKIARRFNMVSELGKILDPVADKITQGVLLICLLSKYDLLKWMFVFFLLKESYMAIAGIKVLERTNRNDGAMWYGKVNTTVFYIVMLLLIFLPDMPTDHCVYRLHGIIACALCEKVPESDKKEQRGTGEERFMNILFRQIWNVSYK